MEASPEEVGHTVAQATLAALGYLSREDRVAIARQLSRVMTLDAERKRIIADILDRLGMGGRDSPPTLDAAGIVAVLANGIRILRDPGEGQR